MSNERDREVAALQAELKEYKLQVAHPTVSTLWATADYVHLG